MRQTNYGGKRLKSLKIIKFMVCAVFLVGTFICIGATYRPGIESDLQPAETTLQHKIEAYKKFKLHYEDKDFQLDSYAVRRVEHVNGKSSACSINIYHITYGIITDNLKEYDKSRKQIVRNTTQVQASRAPDCHGGLYFEDYTENGPTLTCLEDAELLTRYRSY